MRLQVLIFTVIIFPSAARACDLCGCYTPQLESMPENKNSMTGFYTAVVEQFTHFGSLQFDDRDVANPTGQRLESSITQFVAGYGITIAWLCNSMSRLFTANFGGRRLLP